MNLFTNSIEWMAEHSYTNCHAYGVDSIMFNDTLGEKLRLFVAHGDHQLFKNRIPLTEPMSVAIHPHHCDVRLIPLQGFIYNVVCANRFDLESPGWPHSLTRYEYQSAIRSGEARFVPQGRECLNLEIHLLTRPVSLPAHTRHSIFVEQGRTAAWFVEEGVEDPHYESLCWSNAELDNNGLSGLYGRLTVSRVAEILNGLGLTWRNKDA